MFGELVRNSPDLANNVRKARALWGTYIAFENRYWFTEVTHKPQGHLFYEKLHAVMNASGVHDELSREVADLQAHYEREAERLTSMTLFTLTVFGLPIGVLVGSFADTLGTDPFWKQFVLIGVAIYFGVMVLLWLARRISRG